jgi:choline dehydrogenase-like flavoprotein
VAIADARQLAAATVVDADICIVGGGAAGIALAAELSASGQQLCVVESGGYVADQLTQSLYDLESTGYPLRENYMSRARYLGGSCNLWAGRSMLLAEQDVLSRDWVPHSGWPIAHADVAAYYPRAARVLDLPGIATGDLQRYQHLISPLERELFADGVLVPTISLWARRPKRFGADYRATLRRSRHVRVLLNASITAINLNQAGTAVDSLSAATLNQRQFRVRARHYVLACGGLENARLLLASGGRHAGGIANDHGQVGRYFMDHPRAVFGRVHVPAAARLYTLRGRPLPDGKLQIGIGLSAATQRREQLLNHYVTLESQTSGYAEARYQALVQTAKVLLRRGHAGSRWDFRRMQLRDLPNLAYLLSPKELMPHWLYRAYVAGREALPRRERPETFIVVYFCEQPPDPASRVTLGSDSDALGVRRLKLHWHIGESVRDSVLRMQQLLQRQLAAAGMGTLEPGTGEIAFTDASHHMGTTRMSRDLKQGVVDGNCRVHGIDNLFIAGSSVFPCAGYANPTITIVALALRLAEHLRSLPRQ